MPEMDDLILRIKADIADYEKKMKSAKGILDKTDKEFTSRAGRMKSSLSGLTQAAGTIMKGYLHYRTFAQDALRVVTSTYKLIDTVAESGDTFDKMSGRVGASTEFLSGMAHAAELGGANIGDVEIAMRRMARVASDADNGLAQAQRTWDALNITVTDGDGKLKASEQLFWEIADALQDVDSETKKAALAQELFGRGGANLLPMLNQGSDAIREQIEEAKRLGIVWSKDDAKAAADFKDANTRLEASMKGLKRQIGAALLPQFTEWANKFSQWASDPSNIEDLKLIANSFINIGESIAWTTRQLTTLIAKATSFGEKGDEVSLVGDPEKFGERYRDFFLKMFSEGGEYRQMSEAWEKNISHLLEKAGVATIDELEKTLNLNLDKLPNTINEGLKKAGKEITSTETEVIGKIRDALATEITGITIDLVSTDEFDKQRNELAVQLGEIEKLLGTSISKDAQILEWWTAKNEQINKAERESWQERLADLATSLQTEEETFLAHQQRMKDFLDFAEQAKLDSTIPFQELRSRLEEEYTDFYKNQLDERQAAFDAWLQSQADAYMEHIYKFQELDNYYFAGNVSGFIKTLNDQVAAEQASLEARQDFMATYQNMMLTAHADAYSLLADLADTAYGSISENLSAVILQSKSAEDAVKAIGQALVKTVVDFIVQKMVAAAVSKAMMAAEQALSVAMAASIAAAWAPAAAMVSLATFGANAAPAQAALVTTVALANVLAGVKPMAEGGRVSQPTLALIGEAGPEWVIPENRMSAVSPGGDVRIDEIVIYTAAQDAEALADELIPVLQYRLKAARRNA